MSKLDLFSLMGCLIFNGLLVYFIILKLPEYLDFEHCDGLFHCFDKFMHQSAAIAYSFKQLLYPHCHDATYC